MPDDQALPAARVFHAGAFDRDFLQHERIGRSTATVFAMNDALALGAMRVLKQSGYRIPDDVSLVGFDNVEEAEYSVPGLTTIDPGRGPIAERAVDLLVDRIARKGPPSTEEILVDFEIISRESHLDSGPVRPGIDVGDCLLRPRE